MSLDFRSLFRPLEVPRLNAPTIPWHKPAASTWALEVGACSKRGELAGAAVFKCEFTFTHGLPRAKAIDEQARRAVAQCDPEQRMTPAQRSTLRVLIGADIAQAVADRASRDVPGARVKVRERVFQLTFHYAVPSAHHTDGGPHRASADGSAPPNAGSEPSVRRVEVTTL